MGAEENAAEEYCFVCGEKIEPGQNFECRNCSNPMCRACWSKNGQDLCPACKVAQR